MPHSRPKEKYNVQGEVSFEAGLHYLAALLHIAGADGEIAPGEMEWLPEEQKLLGAPDEFVEKIKNLDWESTHLETHIDSLAYTFPINAKRTLLYQAIKMAGAEANITHKKKKP